MIGCEKRTRPSSSIAVAHVADPLEPAAVLAGEEDGAVAAALLRLVEGDVGGGDQVGRR